MQIQEMPITELKPYKLIWAKNQMVLSRQDYHWQHEPCLYGWKDGAAHTWNSDRKQTTIMEFAKPVRSDEHPTMKPVSLMGYLIGNSSKQGDIVLDIFGGSGSTLIACEQLDRTCHMMELDPKYVDVVVNRFIGYNGSSNDVYLLRDGKQLHYEDTACC